MVGTRRLGLLRGITEGKPRLWDHWWYFNGTTDYLEMAHNADFDVPDGSESGWYGSWLIGFKDLSTDGINHTLVCKGQYAYSGAGQGDLCFFTYGAYPSLRRIRFGYRVASGSWINCYPNDYISDGANYIVANGSRNSISTQTNVTSFLDDDLGADGGCNGWEGTGLNYHGNSPMYIGVERRYDIPNTYRYYFKGRIYFMAWMLSQTTRWGDSQGMVMLSDLSYVPWIDDPMRHPDQHYAMAAWQFDKPVESTYEAEIESGPNAPYILTVHGSPVLDGP